MIYAYQCANTECGRHFDVVKRVAEMELPENCPSCKASATREFVPTRLYFSGTKVEDAEYNWGLGAITKGKNHRNELAKRKGLIEIGNETPDTIHKYYDKAREEKREQAWASVDKGWVGQE